VDEFCLRRNIFCKQAGYRGVMRTGKEDVRAIPERRKDLFRLSMKNVGIRIAAFDQTGERLRNTLLKVDIFCRKTAPIDARNYRAASADQAEASRPLFCGELDRRCDHAGDLQPAI